MALEVLPTVKIKYPEYSVITPQTMQEFTVRSLNVQEEENFKASILTPNQFANHLNNIIWSCIVKKPESIKTLDDLLNKITIKDRDALLYGVYHISYKDITEYDIYCNNCEKTFAVKINISKCFSMNPYISEEERERYNKLQNKTNIELQPTTQKGILSEDTNNTITVDKDDTSIKDIESIISKRIKLQLDIADNIEVIIKQPLLADEKKLAEDPLFQLTKQQTIGTELLVIDSFEIAHNAAQPDDRHKAIVKEKDNLFVLYKQLPSQDRKKIMNAYSENFGKYCIKLQVSTRCNFCGEETDSTIDLVNQFFRSLYR